MPTHTTDLTSAERTLRARKAALARWSNTSSEAASAQARRSMQRRFEREVDPDGSLEPAERERRADQARRAYFTGLALKSSKARRKRSAA